MKKSLFTLAFLFVILNLFSSNEPAETVINVAEYIKNDISDYTPIVNKILNDTKGNRKTIIIFPKGTYHFYNDMANGKYHAITNHDNGYRFFAFDFRYKKDITIEGNGSEFIFHGKIIPFLIEKANNIHISNINIDWEVPFYLQGNVIERNKNNNETDIIIPNEFQYEFYNNYLFPKGEGWKEWELGENIVFDSRKKAVSYRTDRFYLGDKVYIDQIGNRTFRIKSNFASEPPYKGLIMTFKGSFGSNRHSPAFHIVNSKDVKLYNINIYHAGGMGVIAEKSENIHLDKVNVTIRKGSDRILSTMADATHFSNCRGEVIIENCLFENMLDDATNVHGTYIKVSDIINNRNVVAYINHIQQAGFEFCNKGDSLSVINDSTLLTCGHVTVNKVTYINQKYMRITFNEDISNLIKKGYGLENISWYPNLTFRNNIIRNNRARSILISIPKKVVIENNSFSSMMSAILFEGDMEHWFESGAVNNVIIKNNTFLDGTYGEGNYPTIFINPRIIKSIPQKTYESNIIIENNKFKTFNNSLIRANSVTNLKIINNEFIKSDTYKPWTDDYTFKITNSKMITIKNNINRLEKDFTLGLDYSTANSDIKVENCKIINIK